jgi:hypothetical protein
VPGQTVGDDEGHRIADMADFAVAQQRYVFLGVTRAVGLRDGRLVRNRPEMGDFSGREDQMNPVRRARRVEIVDPEPGGCIGRAQHIGAQLAFGANVIGEGPFARDQLPVFLAQAPMRPRRI